MSLSEVTVHRYPLKGYAKGYLVLMKRSKPDFTIIVPFGDAGADRYAICAAILQISVSRHNAGL
jgi:hypothetical protein